MGWFNKNKKEESESNFGLPELPRMNNDNSLLMPSQDSEYDFNNLSPQNSELPPLPERNLPNFSQQKIKQEITNPEPVMQKSKFSSLDFDEPPKNKSQIYKESMFSTYPEKVPEFGFSNVKKEKVIEKGQQGPVYIRLDKFETTLDAFDKIRTKIKEIEELLKKTKEIRTKEEEELEQWEREIDIIKSKIEAIDRDIFSKLE